MVDVNWRDCQANFLDQLDLPTGKLAGILLQCKGARIGQSTVISQKVHTFNPLKPEEVYILQNSDAGQIFYQRNETGKIFHMDIFHECGLLDHHAVGLAIKNAIEAYNFHYLIKNIVFHPQDKKLVNADWFDIQTGTGGGRVTGSLNYGQKLSLRKAHENHVHVSAMLDMEHLACLFYVVYAVEQEALNAQLELRRNEKIVNISGGNSGQADLSAYADQTDSFLREKDPQRMSLTVKKHQFIQDAADLTEHFDAVQDVRELLNKIEQYNSYNQLLKQTREQCNEHILQRMAGMGLIEIQKKQVSLTSYGQEFKEYLDKRRPDVEAHLRKAIRLVKCLDNQTGLCQLINHKKPALTGQTADFRVTTFEKTGELSIADTIQATAGRSVNDCADFSITPADLRYYQQRKNKKTEICLLLDASASMAGHRIRAAKLLVRHLLLSTPDRISVITFQENRAKVQVQLTRDYKQVEESLNGISAFGSTPLALGVKACLEYLSVAKAKNPFIILITDGMPTLADSSRDPVSDALLAAAEIKKCGYGFTCIGLKPNRDYLSELAKEAGGKLYIFDELDRQAMVKAALAERIQRQL